MAGRNQFQEDPQAGFRPSYADRRREYEAEQQSLSQRRSLENVLYPVKVAEALFETASMAQRAEGQVIAQKEALRKIHEDTEADRAFADATDRLHGSGGADRTMPAGESAAAKRGRLAAILGFEKTQTANSLFERDQLVEHARMKEDVQAMESMGNITTQEWEAMDPALKAKARFDAQFSALRGKGLTEADIQSIDLGGKKVGDVLADPSVFTPRGTVRPDVFGDIMSAAKTALVGREDARTIEKAKSMTLTREMETPQDKSRADSRTSAERTDALMRARQIYNSSLGPVEKTRPLADQDAGFAAWLPKNFPDLVSGGSSGAPAAAPKKLGVGALLPGNGGGNAPVKRFNPETGKIE